MNDTAFVAIIVAGIAFGAPLVYVAMGELVSQRSGVMNLSLDGIMLFSAVGGYGVAAETGSLWLALATSILIGASMSALFAFLSITLRVSQILAALGMLVFTSGMSQYLGRIGDEPLIGRLSGVSIEPYTTGALTDIPLLGPILFGHDFVVYGSWILVALTHFYINHTEPGLRVRAVGNDPRQRRGSRRESGAGAGCSRDHRRRAGRRRRGLLLPGPRAHLAGADPRRTRAGSPLP